MNTNTFHFKIGLCAFRVGAAVLVLSGATQLAQAGVIPYPDPETQNPDTYTFTATATGELFGYFAGSHASYDEQVGLLDNGVLTSGGFGLDDHSSTLGQVFDFGQVTAGDTLVFVDRINGSSYVYSDSSLNGPYDGGVGANHVYSTDAAAGQIDPSIPAGTYVAFEDLPASISDFNYFDDTFVFTDVSTTVVPEPSTWIGGSLLLLPLGLGALRMLRRKQMA